MDWPSAHSTGGKPLLPFPILVSRRKTSQDVVEFSVTDASPFFPVIRLSFQQNKKPCLLWVSRVEKSSLFLYLLTSGLSKAASGRCPRYDLDSLRLNAQPRLNRL